MLKKIVIGADHLGKNLKDKIIEHLESKGIEVLTRTNSYSIPYDGTSKSAFEKWLPFTKNKSE